MSYPSRIAETKAVFAFDTHAMSDTPSIAYFIFYFNFKVRGGKLLLLSPIMRCCPRIWVNFFFITLPPKSGLDRCRICVTYGVSPNLLTFDDSHVIKLRVISYVNGVNIPGKRMWILQIYCMNNSYVFVVNGSKPRKCMNCCHKNIAKLYFPIISLLASGDWIGKIGTHTKRHI